MIQLDPKKIIGTIVRLERRIGDRFPNSGLQHLCNEFLMLAERSKANIEWISKPNITLRVTLCLLIALGIGGLIYSITYVDLKIDNTKIDNIIGISESIFNDIVLIGAAIFFLVTIESRIKRKRAIKRLNELRVIAHVVDMHQLTKDPNRLNTNRLNTESSPKRSLTALELERYLEYSSEMSALIAKVGALYAQSLPDPIVVTTVTEIEGLCTGLSRKIWQKLIILNQKI